MGLLAFSGTLFFFGSGVYLAAVPSLLATSDNAEHVGEAASEAVEQVQRGVADALRSETPEAPATSAESGAPQEGVLTFDGEHLGESTLTDDPSLPSSDDAPAPDAGTQAPASTDAATTDPSTQNPGGNGSITPPATSPSTPEEPDGEAEQAHHAFLVGKAQKLDGYVSEINARIQAFDAVCLSTDLAARQAELAQCENLFAELQREWASLNTYSPPTVKWSAAHGKLVGMYRCLANYIGTYGNAWMSNVTFGNPAEHVDEFMGPIRSSQVNGRNTYLVQYEAYRSELVL